MFVIALVSTINVCREIGNKFSINKSNRLIVYKVYVNLASSITFPRYFAVSVSQYGKQIFTVRRYALHGICDSNSVCPSVRLSVRLSVCHTRGLCPHGPTYDHDFFTIW